MKEILKVIAVLGVLTGLWSFKIAVREFKIPNALTANLQSVPADTLKVDRETGLALDDKLMVVKAHCTSCHSPKLIIQNRFTRDGWKEKIRWMQRTQKLWDLGESEPVVLDYLAKHYGPEPKAFDGRRMPLTNVKWYKLD